MLIRNVGVKNLTAKIGRQLVVWGNHRMFGHFDWNNIGWALDGASLNYKVSKTITLQAAWLRIAEGDCGGAASGGCGGSGQPAGSSRDGNIIFLRAPIKIAGVTVEPAWIWHDGGTNRGKGLAHNRPANQSRHTIGGRATTKQTLSKLRVDITVEGYYQFGEIGNIGPTAGWF